MLHAVYHCAALRCCVLLCCGVGHRFGLEYLTCRFSNSCRSRSVKVAACENCASWKCSSASRNLSAPPPAAHSLTCTQQQQQQEAGLASASGCKCQLCAGRLATRSSSGSQGSAQPAESGAPRLVCRTAGPVTCRITASYGAWVRRWYSTPRPKPAATPSPAAIGSRRRAVTILLSPLRESLL